MKGIAKKRDKGRSTKHPRSRKHGRLVAMFAVGVVVTGTCAGALIRGVDSKNRATIVKRLPHAAAVPQAAPAARSRLHSRLGFQPEAQKMRHRLGKRFREPGREVTVSIGTLTLSGQAHPIKITRVLDDQDVEQVAIAIGGGGASLTWSAKEGARSNGVAAAGSDRTVIERVALDSADKFILAQTRGASYYTIERAVRPAEAGDSESYSGSLWDLVRVVEPQRSERRPQSIWRIHYINTRTGLIDKILYDEQGDLVTVELSDWVNRSGELSAAVTRWTRGGQVLMETSFNSVNHGPRQ